MKLDAGNSKAKILKPPANEAEKKEIAERDYEIFTMRVPKDMNREFSVNCAILHKDKIDVLLEYIVKFNEKHSGKSVEKYQKERSEQYLDGN